MLKTAQAPTHQGIATLYAKGHTLRILGEVVPQLSYCDLDLSHLYDIKNNII